MGTDPTPRSTLIYAERYEVDFQLNRRLGLTRDPFVAAVRAGDLERRTTTGDDAEGAGGFYLWTRTLRELRVQTRNEAGWHRGKHLLIPATLNNDEAIAIAVSSGDHHTGRFGDDPSTKNIKGSATERAVAGNKPQLPYGRGDEPVSFWYLLVDATDEGLWAEVAQPSYYDLAGRVSGWYIRILLGQIEPDGGGTRRRTDLAPTATPPAINVPVSRKSA